MYRRNRKAEINLDDIKQDYAVLAAFFSSRSGKTFIELLEEGAYKVYNDDVGTSTSVEYRFGRQQAFMEMLKSIKQLNNLFDKEVEV